MRLAHAQGVAFSLFRPKGVDLMASGEEDQATMQLEVNGLVHLGAASYGISSARLVFISEFKGRERRAGEPERSVKVVATARGTTPGFFAVSSPPGRFSCSAGDFEARDPAKGVTIYKSKVLAAGGVEERVVCRVRTEDLVRAVGSLDLSVRFGAMDLRFSRAQVQELREFVARLK